MTNKLEILNFTGTWCTSCKMIAPIITQIIEDYKDNTDISIKKIDVDENSDFAKSHNIKSIPVILFIKNGEVIDRINGATSKKIIKDKIDTYSLDI